MTPKFGLIPIFRFSFTHAFVWLYWDYGLKLNINRKRFKILVLKSEGAQSAVTSSRLVFVSHRAFVSAGVSFVDTRVAADRLGFEKILIRKFQDKMLKNNDPLLPLLPAGGFLRGDLLKKTLI